MGRCRRDVWVVALLEMEQPQRKWTRALINDGTERGICIFDVFLGYNTMQEMREDTQ